MAERTKFPVYFAHAKRFRDCTAYIRFDRQNSGVAVCRDGREVPWGQSRSDYLMARRFVRAGEWRIVTEAQATARVTEATHV